MNPALTLATTRRILTQLRHDPRTVVMLILVPTLLMILLRYVFNSTLVFSRVAPALLGVFPFLIMFLIASITTLRERTTATLERLMTLPIGRLDLLFGYALAFGSIAVVQVGARGGRLAVVARPRPRGFGRAAAGDRRPRRAAGHGARAVRQRVRPHGVPGHPVHAGVRAAADPAVRAVRPREDMGWLLRWLSDVMPLSYAVEALTRVTASSTVDAVILRNLLVVACCALLALVLGAATLRRRTP